MSENWEEKKKRFSYSYSYWQPWGLSWSRHFVRSGWFQSTATLQTPYHSPSSPTWINSGGFTFPLVRSPPVLIRTTPPWAARHVASTALLLCDWLTVCVGQSKQRRWDLWKYAPLKRETYRKWHQVLFRALENFHKKSGVLWVVSPPKNLIIGTLHGNEWKGAQMSSVIWE